MQHLPGSAAVAALVLLSGPAQAFDLGGGLSFGGEIKLEHVSDGTESESFIASDVTLGWRSAADGGLGFGFDLTADSLYLISESEDVTAYWGGLVLTTGFGDVTIGAARPVTETIYSFPSFGTSRLTDFRLLAAKGSYISFLTILSDDITPGVSLEGSSGALSYGVSLHELDSPGGNIRSSQIALGYAMANTTILGGFEVLSIPGGNSASSWRLGVVHEMDALTLGAEINVLEGDLNGSDTFVRLHGAYDITEALTVSADVGRVDVSGVTDTVWALGAEYRFGNGGFIQAGTTSLDDDEIWDVGIGLRF